MAINNAVLFLALIFMLGCKKQEVNHPKTDTMVLVFMAANNDLKADAIDCINKMEAGYNGNKKLLVFIKTSDEKSFILKIKKDNTNEIVSDTIYIFGAENTSDPEFVSAVILKSRSLLPADNYGIILWSHASSWAPPLNSFKTKSFGYDSGVEMDIIDLKNALPNDFAFIIFDACSMGSIEALYELKDNARYLIASPTAVLSNSYPYENILPHLFGNLNDLKLVAQKFVAYYKQFDGLYASATITVIDAKELKNFADKVKNLTMHYPPVSGYNAEQIQRFDYDSKDRVNAYDFLSYLENNYQASQYKEVSDQLSKVVLFKDNTEYFLGNSIKIFSGISVYLPLIDDPMLYYYKDLQWYNDSGWKKLFSPTN